jgi:glycine cleavage system H lipoate-binding protein
MIKLPLWLRRGLMLIGGLLLVPVSLILLLLSAILFWPLFLLAVPVGVLTVAAYVVSPNFRGWLDAKIDKQAPCKGLRLAWGIDLHPSHSWARIMFWHVLVGADDLVQAALGPVQAVDLPPVGKRVEEGDRLFSLRRGNRCVEVRAPITGTVLARNEMLTKHPGFVNDEPFHRGWAVRLRAEDVGESKRRLLHGDEARTWFGREIDRLMTSLHADEEVRTCLADGGAVVHDLYRHIDDDAWKRLTESFFAPKAKA